MYEEYFSTLATVGKTFLQMYGELSENDHDDVRQRFRRIAETGKGIGWGFGDYLQEILFDLDP